MRPGLGIAVACLTSMVGCATMQPRDGTVTSEGVTVRDLPGPPHIDRIVPDSVSVAPGSVVEVTIVGRGFAPRQTGLNTIDFAGMTIVAVPANASGTEIRLVIPTAIRSVGEAPPMPIHPGPYAVRVTTDRGTSNTVSLVVLP